MYNLLHDSHHYEEMPTLKHRRVDTKEWLEHMYCKDVAQHNEKVPVKRVSEGRTSPDCDNDEVELSVLADLYVFSGNVTTERTLPWHRNLGCLHWQASRI